MKIDFDIKIASLNESLDTDQFELAKKQQDNVILIFLKKVLESSLQFYFQHDLLLKLKSVQIELDNLRVLYLDALNSKNDEAKKVIQYKGKLETASSDVQSLNIENNDLRQQLKFENLIIKFIIFLTFDIFLEFRTIVLTN